MQITTQKMLNVSARHINIEDFVWLTDDEETKNFAQVYDITKTRHGAELIICIENIDACRNATCIPENIQNMFKSADNMGCNMIHLHNKGHIFSYLNTQTCEINEKILFIQGYPELDHDSAYIQNVAMLNITNMTTKMYADMNDACDFDNPAAIYEKHGDSLHCRGWFIKNHDKNKECINKLLTNISIADNEETIKLPEKTDYIYVNDPFYK